MTDAGVAETEKSPAPGALTVSDTDVVRVRVPLVPVIVSVNVPVAAVALAVTVNVDMPDVITDAGLKLPLAPAGRPLTANATVPLKPPDGVTVTV